jgi:hypothetical protein
MALTIAPKPENAPTPQWKVSDPRFLDPLVIEELDGRNFRVVQEFDYHTDVDTLFVIHIPAGFLTDFASVPKILWNILPPNGQYGKAAVVHDYCYRTPGFCTKDEADSVFLEAMTALGVGWWTRMTMYKAVHFFGGSSYKGGLK